MGVFKAEFAEVDGHRIFQFVEWKDSKEDEKNILKDCIVQEIQDLPGLNKSQVLENLKQRAGITIAEKQFYDLLKGLIRDEFVIVQKGSSKNAQLLFVNEGKEWSLA